MAYNALDVAKYIVSYCFEKENPISNLKLQKMLYFAWVDFYKNTGKELYGDDIYAWKFGPVVPETYYEFCVYAGRSIIKFFDTTLDENDIKVLDEIIDKYVQIPVGTLVEMTHQKGKPWDLIYKNGEGLRKVIPYSLIKKLECEECT